MDQKQKGYKCKYQQLFPWILNEYVKHSPHSFLGRYGIYFNPSIVDGINEIINTHYMNLTENQLWKDEMFNPEKV